MRKDLPEFRTMTWPGGTLPVPKVYAGPVVLRGGILCPFEGDTPGTRNRVSVSEELYLREVRQLKLSDEEALRDFTRHHGTVYCEDLARVLKAAAGPGGWRDYADDAQRLADRQRELRGKVMHLAMDLLMSWKEKWLLLEAAEKHQLLSPEDAAHLQTMRHTSVPATEAFCHVDEMRWTVALIRDIARVWLWAQGELSFTRVQIEWESPVRPATEQGPWPAKEEALRMLEATLNLGLAELRPRVSLGLAGGENADAWKDEPVSLFSALCVQFANHIIENAKYKKCENCGTWFVRQLGRAEQGQHRTTGTKYCSVRCAKAKTQREYYARHHKGGGT